LSNIVFIIRPFPQLISYSLFSWRSHSKKNCIKPAFAYPSSLKLRRDFGLRRGITFY